MVAATGAPEDHGSRRIGDIPPWSLTMNIGLSRLALWLHRTRRVSRARPPRASWVPSELPELEEDQEDELPKGCGWFDSSHELRQGLAVSEQLDADAAAAMPLRDWIDWHMRVEMRGVEALRRPAAA
jgi:hypothetical protein